MTVTPKLGQRYLFEGPDSFGQECKLIYEITAIRQEVKNGEWDYTLGIKLLQVKNGSSYHRYEPYEEDKLSDLINEKCSFTYLEGQDRPYVQ
jgi:hypothetical protein